MSLNAKDAPGTCPRTPPLEPGTYPGHLVLVVDLGLQPGQIWQGVQKPPANQLLLTYEFVDEFLLDEDGQEIKDKPRWLSETMVLYNLEAEKAKSTLRYNVLDPNHVHKGDFSQLVGAPCNITVVQNPKKGRVYENIAGISAMRSKDVMKCPPLINKAMSFDLDVPNMEVFSSLPNWMQKKIVSNLEFKGSKLEGMLKVEEGFLEPIVVKDINETVETPF